MRKCTRGLWFGLCASWLIGCGNAQSVAGDDGATVETGALQVPDAGSDVQDTGPAGTDANAPLDLDEVATDAPDAIAPPDAATPDGDAVADEITALDEVAADLDSDGDGSDVAALDEEAADAGSDVADPPDAETAGSECASNVDCATKHGAGPVCQQWQCAEGACTLGAATSPCDDGNACTTGDTCTVGGCVGSATVSCDDGDACTSDTCAPAMGCSHGAIACDDGNPCTFETCDPAIGCKSAGAAATGTACTAAFGSGFCDAGTCSSCLAAGNLGCPASTPCLTYTCQQTGAGYCNPTLMLDAPCDDGNACTTSDHCVSAADGSCVGSAKSCDDGTPCTSDSCADGVCVNTLVPDAPCDDGNPCTTGDVCGGSATGCAGAAASGIACDDGSACTVNDTCSGGACAGTSACDDSNACTTDACVPATGCTHTVIACDDANTCTADSCVPASGCAHANVSGACDDGNACTPNDTCANGLCGTTGNCDDGNACTTDACVSATTCTHAAIACDDGNACTVDACDAASGCSHVAKNCDADASPCTLEACEPATGCKSNGNATTGTACTLATGGAGYCDTGNCSGCIAANNLGCPANTACTAYACQQMPLGVCKATFLVAACDDGNPCSASDACASGVCQPGGQIAVTCDDGNPCTSGDHCTSTAANSCTGTVKSCDDANPCTSDACAGGVCAHTPVSGGACDDGNACTSGDVCSSQSPGQCLGTAVAAGTPCNDGNACTQGDNCVAGVSCAGTLSCDDANACTIDACVSAACTHTAISCDDGNACTIDACQPMVGCTTTVKACADSNVCTLEACDPVSGCKANGNATPGMACTRTVGGVAVGGYCDAGVCGECYASQGCPAAGPCTTVTCQAGTPDVCVTVNLQLGTACSDGVPCDPAGTCTANGTCAPPANSGKSCDDGNMCTNDACVNNACTHTAASSAVLCDDGNACTTNDACGGGKCAGTVAPGGTVCDDSNVCTVNDVCANGVCAGVAKCSDGDPCTADNCASGVCSYPALTCNDSNGCTTDFCNATTGCVNAVTAGLEAVVSMGSTCELFAYSSAIDGDTLIIGSAAGAVGSNNVHIYGRSGHIWTLQASFAPNCGTMVVGVAGATAVAQCNDSVLVWTRTGATWSQQAVLTASNATAGDFFASSVAISGDTVAVGARAQSPVSATGVPGSGAAYVFARTGTVWTQQAFLKPVNGDASDFFGRAVALDGNTLVVGAPGEDSNQTTITNGTTASVSNVASNSGAAYVYTRSGTTWSQQAYLKAPNPDVNDAFGGSVAVSADTVVVGALGEDSNATGVGGNLASNVASNAGAAYVFTRAGTAWSLQAYVKASNTGAGDDFGVRAAIAGDTMVIASDNEKSAAVGVNGDQASDAGGNVGAVYALVRSGSTWTQRAYLKASPATPSAFGRSLSISGSSIAVGNGACDYPESEYIYILGAVTCDDNNPCTDPVASGGSCTCTQTNNVQACASDGNACTDDKCSGGACLHTAGVGPCTDDNVCTDDVCVGSLCVSTNNNTNTCTDNNSCTADACQAGVCVHSTLSDGTACSDGDACTTGETCSAGVCQGAAPIVCGDCQVCSNNSGCVDNHPCCGDFCCLYPTDCLCTGGC